MPVRWPFLLRMTNQRAEQINCITALVGSYNWKKVVLIYEDDGNGGDTGDMTLLEAKEMGFVRMDSVWIISNAITSFLNSFNSYVISYMEGALGIKPYFSEDSSSYIDFKVRFKKAFRAKYSEEDSSDPRFYALKAYDSIKTVELCETFPNTL
ncbi:hypothetical protein QYF36_023083 [Acer negundo]|nr:hypothetical protein QYF36_023083 [Acer negundo]